MTPPWKDDETPLFPLHAVLFPAGELHLRLFEPRYTDMISHCIKGEKQFGVVLIESGEETGVAAQVHPVGTFARINNWDMGVDGLLEVRCVGTRRFRILERRVTPAQLLLAKVASYAAPKQGSVPVQFQSLVDLLQRLWEQEGAKFNHRPTAFGDAAWVSERLLELLPLPLPEKQRFLELANPLAALRHLAPLISPAGNA